MNCQRLQASFLDYHEGSLTDAEAADVRQHLRSCPHCQREWSGLQEVHLKLDRLAAAGAPAPNLRVKERFYAMLAEEERGLNSPGPFAQMRSRVDRFFEALLPARPAFQFGFAVILLLAGLFVGSRFLSQPVSPHRDDAATRAELAELRRKVDSMSQVMAASLAQQQPANARLQSVLTALRTGPADEAKLAELINTLAFDPSANVRLSALEVLYAHSREPFVRSGVLASLPREPSPLVQLAMIDFVTAIRDADAVPALESLTRSPSIHETVRDAARRALAQL